MATWFLSLCQSQTKRVLKRASEKAVPIVAAKPTRGVLCVGTVLFFVFCFFLLFFFFFFFFFPICMRSAFHLFLSQHQFCFPGTSCTPCVVLRRVRLSNTTFVKWSPTIERDESRKCLATHPQRTLSVTADCPAQPLKMPLRWLFLSPGNTRNGLHCAMPNVRD